MALTPREDAIRALTERAEKAEAEVKRLTELLAIRNREMDDAYAWASRAEERRP